MYFCAASVIGLLAVDVAHKNKEMNWIELNWKMMIMMCDDGSEPSELWLGKIRRSYKYYSIVAMAEIGLR
jgi:hypothetical protein